LPYLATSGNIDSTQTTSGYQSLYNEVFWSYRDIEPTPNDNIFIAFFEPYEWMKIQTMEGQVEKNPNDIDTWVKLFAEYASGAPYYSNETITALFERAIKFNPDNADLYARYAEFLMPNCCYYKSRGDTSLPPGAREYANSRILPLLNRAFALDPNNQIADEVLGSLEYVFSDLTITPPLTIPPTATSLFTATPSVTPSATITPTSTETPIVVRVIQTKLVYARTATPMPKSTEIIVPTPIAAQTETQKESNYSFFIFGALGVFIAGIGSGWFLSKRQKNK
jgi:hypothetical protein